MILFPGFPTTRQVHFHFPNIDLECFAERRHLAEALTPSVCLTAARRIRYWETFVLISLRRSNVWNDERSPFPLRWATLAGCQFTLEMKGSTEELCTRKIGDSTVWETSGESNVYDEKAANA